MVYKNNITYKKYKTVLYIPYNALVLALADSSISSSGLPLMIDISLAMFKIILELLHRIDLGNLSGNMYGASVSNSNLFSGRLATVLWTFFSLG